MHASPFLMFQNGKARDALDLYAAHFDDFAIEEMERYGPQGPGAEGTILRARFRVAGLSVMCIDSPIEHAFAFTPSFSFFVDCDSIERMEALVGGLGEGGHMLMPPDDYGFSRRFAWLNDRFGVSWQINLP